MGQRRFRESLGGACEVSLRGRLLLIFGGIVAITVALVSYAVSVGARRVFERLDEERTLAINGQFKKEFQLQGEILSGRTRAIANSQPIQSMALALSTANGDPAAYLRLASSLADQLDYLDILSTDGSIISSAEWPARFGVRESWIAEVPNWNELPPFLRYQETPQGPELALLSVRQTTGEGNFYVVAGRRIDWKFLGSLVLPRGTTLLLWQPNGNAGADLQDSSGPVGMPTELKPLVEQARNENAEITRRLRLNATSEGSVVAHTIPLVGRESTRPLAVLVITSSRRELSDLQSRIRTISLLVALGGILLSVIASGWWASRVSRPIAELSSAAQDVAAGDWERKVSPGSLDQRDEIARLIASFNKMTDELLRQRDRAIQAERVAAWRELARRLPHELKNPMFPLQITIENLMRARAQNSPEFDEIFAESTTTLLAELNSLKKIVGRFSDFSKMPAPQLEDVNLNHLLEEIARLFAPQLANALKPINLETSFTTANPTIAGDPDLLRRAFENLVLNAIDAMPNGGKLRLTTSAVDRVLRVEISDSGAGLTEQEAKKLFTPYYTTKQHGTGLGLAIVQSILSDHGARISVRSDPGKGTTFVVEFQSRSAPQATTSIGAARVQA
jgi:two-component system, NtrC family, nitrogen regulation sensor histidine kinase NtrY